MKKAVCILVVMAGEAYRFFTYFDHVLICCYVAMRGNISYEEWRNLERFYDDENMLPANVAQLLIRDEVPFSYVQQFTYDDFCCEVITIDDDLIGRLWLKPW